MKSKKQKLSPLAKEIASGLKDFIAYKKGKKVRGITVHKYPVISPDEIDVKEIRNKLGMSQSEFTKFGFSLSAIRHWEANRRIPEGSARILLMIIDKNPNVVLRTLKQHI